MRRRARALVAVVVALAVVAVAGCGRDDFENEPRPPVPAEVSIEIGDNQVVVSPSEFGAGLVNFTIVNLGNVSAALEIDGPTVAETPEELAPGTTANLKAEVTTGDYEAIATGTDAEPFVFAVGPERESAQDQLLLP